MCTCTYKKNILWLTLIAGSKSVTPVSIDKTSNVRSTLQYKSIITIECDYDSRSSCCGWQNSRGRHVKGWTTHYNKSILNTCIIHVHVHYIHVHVDSHTCTCRVRYMYMYIYQQDTTYYDVLHLKVHIMLVKLHLHTCIILL